jgi:nicotinamide mononucleotide transporter
MPHLIQAIEIFALVTGVIYVILEIMQKNAMWVVGILTASACAFSFGVQHVWASMGLNIYYVAMSVIGLYKWRKDQGKVAEGDIHLNTITKGAAFWSGIAALAGTLAFIWILRKTGDAAPELDAAATVLSIIGTWWLAMSYLEQWFIWIVADVITTTLCIVTGQYALAALYLAYIVSAVYGYFHWKRRGKVVNSAQ